MVELQLHLLPVFLSVLSICTFVTTYIIAVALEHVLPTYPYISDTGAFPPESSIFTMLLNIGLFCQICCLSLRYLQLEEVRRVLGESAPRDFHSCNVTSIVFGAFGCLGISLLANFQKSTNRYVHSFGAAMYFVCCTVYFAFQTYFSWKLSSEITPRYLFYFRIGIMAVLIPVTIITPGFAVTAKRKFKGRSVFKWGPEDGGWELHVASVISEWILVLGHSIFLATFAEDFRNLSFRYPLLHVTFLSNSTSSS